MNNTSVSIVITSFNYGHFLGDAIESVLSQTLAPRQIIVVDDGSTDNTREVAERYAGRVDYVAIPHSGVCAARNAGLSRVNSEFVVFLDADDALHPSYLEATLSAWTRAQHLNPSFIYTQRTDFETGAGESHYPEFDPDLLKFRNYIMVTALIRSEAARVQGFDPAFANGLEDHDFFLGLVEKSHTGVLLDKPLLRVRRHAASRNQAAETPAMRWNLMRMILAKHHSLYTAADRRRFRRDLGDFIATRIMRARHHRQPFRDRAVNLARLIRYRAPMQALFSQTLFMLDPSPVYEALRHGLTNAARRRCLGLSPRRWSNTELKRFAPFFAGDVVNVSGWRDEDKEGRLYRDYFVNASRYSITNYWGSHVANDGIPDSIFLDLATDLPPELRDRFDVAFHHTVLEHVVDSCKAMRNIAAMTRDIMIMVVPFSQDEHYMSGLYGDYWRFTPLCVRQLMEDNGFTLLYLSSNDSPWYPVYLFAIGSKQPARWVNKFPDPYDWESRLSRATFVYPSCTW